MNAADREVSGFLFFAVVKFLPKYLDIRRNISTFVPSDEIIMKRYKVKEVIEMLEADGWYLATTKGSHRQFKHPAKKGRVTVNKKLSETLEQEILNSIFKQAGWR